MRSVRTSNGWPVKNSELSRKDRRATRAAALLYLAAGILCCRVPLLNYLGYESSFLFGFLASLVTGSLVAGATRRAVRSAGPEGWSIHALLQLFRRELRTCLLLLLIPLALLSANALVVKNCNYLEGLAYYFLIPCVSIWFSAAVGFFCGVHYRHGRLAFLSLVAASLLYVLYLGYATPAIFSYNFFYGYFPGLSYDEALGISRPLVYFRALTAGLGGLALWWALLLVRSSAAEKPTLEKGKALIAALTARGRRTQGASIVAAAVLLYLFRCELGWESTAPFIQGRLGARYDTPHVTLYYPPSALSAAEIRRIGGEHEFRLAQLVRDFGAAASPHVESYLYPDAATKWRLIGAGNTNIAKPWSGQIHCTLQSLESTLKHELAHVVAGPFGLPIIRASLRTGLVEGLATALDPTWLNRTLHQYAAALQRFGPKPQIASMMSLWGFTAQNSALSYISAGSFCRYLLDAYGVKPLLAVYGGADFTEEFGRSLPELVTEWERFLGRMHVEDRERGVLDALFHRPPIFGKTCARVIAGRMEAARIALARREYARAQTLYGASFEEAGGYDAFGGLLAATVRLGKYGDAIRLCDSVIHGSERPDRYLPLFLWCGDARWAMGDPHGAQRLYDRLLDADLAENLTEGSAARTLALSDSLHRPTFLAAFLLDAPDSIRIIMLDSLARVAPESSPLLRYLAGRVLARRGESASAIAILQALDLSGLSRPLEYLRRKTVGEQNYLLGNYQEARRAFWSSLDGLTNEAAAYEAREWVTRCDWMARHGY